MTEAVESRRNEIAGRGVTTAAPTVVDDSPGFALRMLNLLVPEDVAQAIAALPTFPERPRSSDREHAAQHPSERRPSRSNDRSDDDNAARTIGVELQGPAAAAAALLRTPVNGRSANAPADLTTPQRETSGAGGDRRERTDQAIDQPLNAAGDSHQRNVEQVRDNGAEISSIEPANASAQQCQHASSIAQASGDESSEYAGGVAGDGQTRATTGSVQPVDATAGAIAATGSASGNAGAGGRQASDQSLKSLLSPTGVLGVKTTGPRTVQATGAQDVRSPKRGIMQAEDDLVGQVGRGLAAVLRQKGGSVTIRLAPEALGQVRVHLNFENAQVSARFEASSKEAHDLLSRGSEELRAALESRGVRVDSVQVVRMGDPDGTTQGQAPCAESGTRHQPGLSQDQAGHAESERHAMHDQSRSQSGNRSASASEPVRPRVEHESVGGCKYATFDGSLLRVDMTV